MRVNERMKKLLSIVLTLCMVLSYIPAPAYAVAADFAVTIAEATNGKVEADKTTATEGDTITLTVTADEGYELDTLTVMNGETAVEVNDNSFIMPAANVTISATFKEVASGIQAGYYLVGTLNGENKLSVDRDSADRLLKEDTNVEGQFCLEYTFAAGDELKIAYFDGQEIKKWYKEDDFYPISEAKAGKYILLFRPEGNGLWSHTYFTVTPAYSVTVNTVENGAVTADKAVATADETVTLKVTPAEGYELESLTVVSSENPEDPISTTKNENGTYSFVMPRSDVTVSATFKLIPTCTCTVKCGETADTNCAVCSAAGADLTAVCIAEPANAEDGVVEVSTEAELVAALEKGGNIMLTGDITVSDEYPLGYDITKNTAINLNGHTITGESVFNLLGHEGHEENIVLTISGNGTIKNTDPNVTSAILGYGMLNILGGTIEGGTKISGPTIMSGGQVDQLIVDEGNSIITGGYVGELHCLSDGILTISGGTFGFDPTAYLAEGYKTAQEDGKWVAICADGCEYTYSDNGDGTHTATCSVCGHKVTEEHSTEKDENEANCHHGNICDLCGKSYGEPDKTNHDTTVSLNENGLCPYCNGAYAQPEGSGTGEEPYLIANAGNLYWFAAQVNSGETTINAILMNDIVINSQVLDADGNLIADPSGLRQWTPIGQYISETDNPGFAGTFNGNGKTIRGLYHYGDSAKYAGLFGYSAGTIRDLAIADAYIHTTHSDGRAGSVTGLNEGTVSNCHNSGFVGGNGQIGGIVGRMNAGTIENCSNSGTITGNSYVGGICGYEGGKIQNCSNSGTVNGNLDVGGIAGWNRGAIEKCSNSGTITGNSYVGGVAGLVSGGTINNCYNVGSVEATNECAGGIAGGVQNTSNISNCFSGGLVKVPSSVGGIVGNVLNNSATNVTITNGYYDNLVYSGNDIDTIGPQAKVTRTKVEGKTTEAFSSGEVTWLLNGESAEGVWKQTLNADSAPGFTGGTVYYGYVDCGSTEAVYTNTTVSTEPVEHDYENGFCEQVSGQTHYEPATLVTAENCTELGLADSYIGYYAITNAGQLYWIADKVDNDNANFGAANVVLTDNITVNSGTLTANSAGARVWNPIGRYTYIHSDDAVFSGTFDGNGKTVSGLYYNDSAKTSRYIGLVACVAEGGTVKHVTLSNSYISGYRHTGGIAGENYGTITGCVNNAAIGGEGEQGGIVGENYGTVELCGNTGTITNTWCYSGGIVGYSYGIIRNCWNTGSFSGGTSCAGGIVGAQVNKDSLTENCWSKGQVTGIECGSIAGWLNGAATVQNCYSDKDTLVGKRSSNNGDPITTNVQKKFTAAFASGEVAYLLRTRAAAGTNVWGQNLDNGKTVQTVPTFDGADVYYGYTSCGDTEKKYTNNAAATQEKPEHTQNPTYTDNHDGTHSASYSCCGTTVQPEGHNFENEAHQCACGVFKPFNLYADGQTLAVAYGSDLADAVADITPEKTGYTHTGEWTYYYLDEEGTEQPYTGTTMPAKELYAQPVFTPIEYNITWDMAGCSYYVSNYNGLPMKLAYNVDGNAHNVNFTDITAPEGYEFVRFEDGDGNALSYVVTDKYRLNLTVSGDMTVKAVIQPKAYMATWTSVDGGGYEKAFKYGETITIPTSVFFVETFRKAGYTLTGWEGYTEGMTMPIGGVTFTAKWQINAASLAETSGKYTGKAHTPVVTVKGLTEGTDFTVTYPEDMVNVGEKVITVTGTLGGTTTVTYTITKADAPVIAFPTVLNEITYRQQVQEAKLSFYENEYGTFNWASPSGYPDGAGERNYALDFYPKDLENYDWAACTWTTHGATWIENRNALCTTAKVIVNRAESIIETEPVARTLTYTGQPQELVTAGSVVGGTLQYSVNGGEWSESVPTATEAGRYYISYQVVGNSNYIGIGVRALPAMEIDQAVLTITAKDHTITYGDTPSDNGIAYDGFVNGETEAVLGGTVAYTCNYEQYDNAGTYKITPVGLTSDNYKIIFKDGTLTVNKKPITVEANAVSKTYGEADPELTYKANGLVNGDKLTGKLKRAAGENVGSYAIEQNTLTAGNNYAITYTGANLTINAKAITEADVELNGSLTYTGKKQTQPITVTEGITYEVTGNKATNVGTYELTVKGTGNYTGSVTLDWTIAKAKLTITADSKVIYIGEKVPTLTYTASGLVGGDKLTKEPVLTTNADADQAGSYTITAANADAGDNYTITYVSGSLTIMDKETEVETKIEQTELTEVPEGLKDTQFDTVEEIKEELISKILATSTGYSAENMVHYDVALHFSLDGGDSWILATEENFPTEGITVILPYPEGTNARDYEFVVSHMFTVTSQRLGTVAGEVEMPKVEETANGISVTLNGLSPVTVAARYHDHTGGTATCSDKAICSICGNAYGELDATNHAGGTEVKNAKEATCGAEGYTGDTHCKGCDEVVEKGTTIKATGEHTYGDWKVVKEPTKTTKGEKQRTCSICGHVESKEIPVLSDTPATGDNSNIMLYSSMFTVSLAGLVVLLLAAKKRKQETA